MLGDRARRRGSTVIAAFHYADALALNYELGSRLGMAQCLERVAHLASLRGKPMQLPGSSAAPRRSAAPLALHPDQQRNRICKPRSPPFAPIWMKTPLRRLGYQAKPCRKRKRSPRPLRFFSNPVDAVEELPAQSQHVLPAQAATVGDVSI